MVRIHSGIPILRSSGFWLECCTNSWKRRSVFSRSLYRLTAWVCWEQKAPYADCQCTAASAWNWFKSTSAMLGITVPQSWNDAKLINRTFMTYVKSLLTKYISILSTYNQWQKNTSYRSLILCKLTCFNQRKIINIFTITEYKCIIKIISPVQP